MKPLYVEAVGLAAPGLPDWASAQPVLRGEAPYAAAELPAYSPERLPPNERRRATASVRLAFRCCEDALKSTSRPPAELATVFASSDGDLEIVHRINNGLVQAVRSVSPTDFHNSVHNAPAGYWSIAVGSRRPSCSLAAHDGSVAAGLLEASALVTEDGFDTLFAAYDVKAPVVLMAHRAVPQPFGFALVLAAARTAQSLGQLAFAPAAEPESGLTAGLEELRRANPIARALPLLALIALRKAGDAVLPAPGGALRVSYTP